MISSLAASADLLTSMRTIKRISSIMLETKFREVQESGEFNTISSGNMEVVGKKDIMSLLVRARAERDRQQQMGQGGKVEDEEDPGSGYGMDEKAIMDQVVRILS
jgi:hypothetical protein